ncbi:MAG: Mov34/MPN/PAD-1 family protein, partial [Anaerolineae bacterium]
VGLLVGVFEGGGRVEAVYPAHNLNTERTHDRYELDPADYLAVEWGIEGSGLEIIGFYHSHPDDEACPSAFDLERAWEEYFYLIVSVRDGTATEARAWAIDETTGRFQEKDLEVVPS